MMDMPADRETFLREIEISKISILEDFIKLLMKVSVEPGMSEGCRIATTLAAAALHRAVLEVRGQDTSRASEVVRFEYEAFQNAAAD